MRFLRLGQMADGLGADRPGFGFRLFSPAASCWSVFPSVRWTDGSSPLTAVSSGPNEEGARISVPGRGQVPYLEPLSSRRARGVFARHAANAQEIVIATPYQ